MTDDLKDRTDAEIARQALAQIEAHPEQVLRGAELEQRLDTWMNQDGNGQLSGNAERPPGDDKEEAFAAALARLEACDQDLGDAVAAVQEEYEVAVWAAFKAAKPKSRERDVGKMIYALGPTAAGPIREPFAARVADLTKACRAQRETIEGELLELAKHVDVPVAADMTQHATVSSNDYRSQTAANKYASARAEMIAMEARVHGAQAEVRVVATHGNPSPWGADVWRDYGVFVNTDAFGWEILRRKPALSMRDWLKACYKLGANPRVYDPFLPHGLEERLGVSYFGDDLAPSPGPERKERP